MGATAPTAVTGSYGNYDSYGRYNDSHYSNKDDSSIKTKKK